MKAILVLLLPCLISFNSFSQKVAYKDLIGTKWVSLDTVSATTTTYIFIDSTNMIDSSWAPRYQPVEKNTQKYSLDTANSITILSILKYTGKYANESWKYLIRIKDRDVLILQSYSIPNIGNIRELANKNLIMKRSNF
jgi:hypothetical protein